jgi:Flp pilus assembly protein TadD
MKTRSPAVLPICAALLGAILGGCVSAPPQTDSHYQPAELLPARAPFYSEGDAVDLPEVDLLALDDDMKVFLDNLLAGGTTEYARLRILLDAILDAGPLHLEYSNLQTLTAQETFHARAGNCLSFTNLFIALAREAGLNAWYQEVDVPDTWERVDETWMYNRHINAVVDTRGLGRQAVDFNFTRYSSELPQKRISDRKAQAQYYNNLGVYWMQEQRLDLAYLHLRKAVELDDDAAYFWTNIGALYRRAGDDRRAEAAWLAALEVGDEPSALSNLARYYARNGNEASAAWYGEAVERYRQRNPYYLYDLAENAYQGAEFDQSRRLLQRALRIREDEPEFHRLLSLSYAKLGDFKAAAKSMREAEHFSKLTGQRQHYNHKQQMLDKMAAK